MIRISDAYRPETSSELEDERKAKADKSDMEKRPVVAVPVGKEDGCDVVGEGVGADDKDAERLSR